VDRFANLESKTARSINPPRGLPEQRLSIFSLDGLALIALFFQATELYRPLGYFAGLATSQQVNLAFMGFWAFYLTVRHRTLMSLRTGATWAWVCLLFLAPLWVMMLQLLDDSITSGRIVYWAGFSLNFTLMFLAAVALWARWSPKLTAPFFLASIAGVWVGFVVSWLDYGTIREVMRFSANLRSESVQSARAIGFFGHPNLAALALVLFLACLVCDRNYLNRPVALQSLATMGSAVGVLVTGSRTSLLLLSVVLLVYFYNLLKLHNRGTDSPRRRMRTTLVPLLPIALIASTVIAIQYVSAVRPEAGSLIGSRVNSILELAGGTTDESMNIRLSVLSQYAEEIREAPILGRGPDYDEEQVERGNFSNTSQNAWLRYALRFGVPYSLFLLLTLYLTYYARKDLNGSNQLFLSRKRLILGLLILVTLSISSPLWIRSTVCVLGALLGTIAFTGARAPEIAFTSAEMKDALTQPRLVATHRDLRSSPSDFTSDPR
jgi:hypothetical protein